MIQKVCPYCGLDSYSAYNDPNWLCPYCGKRIGNNSLKAQKGKGLTVIKGNRQQTGAGDHLRVVNQKLNG